MPLAALCSGPIELSRSGGAWTDPIFRATASASAASGSSVTEGAKGMTDLETALALADESGAPGLVFACRLALMSATALLGRAPAERRRLYEDAVGHAHEHGYV